MPKYTNKHNIPLPLAVLLATDEYDHNDEPWTISATKLLGSVRQIVLESRVSAEEVEIDISDLIASTQGTALHDAMERAWLNPKLPEVLKSLGLPARVADKVRVNPTEGKTNLDVHLERRTSKKIGKWTVSGKFDFIMEEMPMDLKNTSVYSWGKSSDDYKMQLSMYRWLNPDITSKDLGKIMFWFKNWSEYAKKGDGYPPFTIAEKTINLLSPAHTEHWVSQKLNQIDLYWNTPESELPLCTPEEMWQAPSEFKYYSSATSQRASKKFDNTHEAHTYMLSKGKGEVREIKQSPTKCGYCNARFKCSQYASMVQQGIVK
ncbi:exonuclease [Vibrio phage 1.245.O._10N.261.54.C7]|uniref:PD-(D/E)XK nuclease superfamily protein n=1 Tax=Vibrio phage 1.245.O._10N.261.54.C7 TaxID=1881236 RepID=A0A2I7RWD5_9CAUD|nr:exonuclease [Vibrio phage 1.245.O._10N.261.54.C7]AUR97966.1 PD-(D/E)XK nuclease superfamily protein [Vibrio phage 1.245.O._10N.261.54.C7]